jgi:LPS O-antigen subunit length determinant protein (WzzB/FepE family)
LEIQSITDEESVERLRATPVCDIIDSILRIFAREDFVFSQRYNIVATFKEPYGKWTSLFKNSVYIDSKDFHIIYGEKFTERVLIILERHMEQNENNTITQEQYFATAQVLEMINVVVKESKFQEYAFTGILKGKDSAA